MSSWLLGMVEVLLFVHESLSYLQVKQQSLSEVGMPIHLRKSMNHASLLSLTHGEVGSLPRAQRSDPVSCPFTPLLL
jgi:hypothetical protein